MHGTPSEESPEIERHIREIIQLAGGKASSFESDLIFQQIQNSLKMLAEGHDIGQLKLITRSLKEMRYAYRIFNAYGGARRISIFGSSRTPEDHPDYRLAKEFSALMVHEGWMCMTGAANGIMKAGHEGSKKESSFGLSIRLPFESTSNEIIEGDPKLIIFRYFFTRKLMFMSHSDALAAFPGGFGTMDELFEALTLLQTGKASIVPIVLLEGTPGQYWKHWERYILDYFLDNGWIGEEDVHFYYLAHSAEDAKQHVQKFYRRYHSSRYVKDQLVIRLHEPLHPDQLDLLNEKFSSLVQSGKMVLSNPFPEENELLDLPRLSFHHTRRQFGKIRALIDQINSF